MKALYIICNEKEVDIVGYNVYNYLNDNYQLIKHETSSDLASVYTIDKKDGHEYLLMFTKEHVMHHTPKYIDYLNQNFSDVEAAIHLNYHIGASAPDPILSVHQVGDVLSGVYLPHNPQYATNLLVGMERIRKENGLDNYTCESETVHYSGVVSGIDPHVLLEYPINNIDLEIGSVYESMDNELAIKVISETIFEIFKEDPLQRLHVLYVGGAHFEATYTNAILSNEYPIHWSHQLAGVWINQIDPNRISADLQSIIDKAKIPYDAIVFHEKVKKLKPIMQEVADANNIKLFKYNALKNIENSEMKNLFQ